MSDRKDGRMQADHGPAAMSPVLTNHARERAQARGVALRIVAAIFANADRSPFVGGGCRSLMITRRKLARLDDSVPPADRERMDSVVLVVDRKSNMIITVFHDYGPNARHYRRQHNGCRHRVRRKRRLRPARRYAHQHDQ